MIDQLKYQIYLAKEWVLRVVYCHHNARVLVDTEHRLSVLLDAATGGLLSKPGYDASVMLDAYYEHLNRERREAFEEGRNTVSVADYLD